MGALPLNIGGAKIVQAALGFYHTIVLSDENRSSKVFSFGLNDHHQLGNRSGKMNWGTGELSLSKPTELTELRARCIRGIAAGAMHSVFYTWEDQVFTCGLNECGQLGYTGKHTNHGP